LKKQLKVKLNEELNNQGQVGEQWRNQMICCNSFRGEIKETNKRKRWESTENKEIESRKDVTELVWCTWRRSKNNVVSH